MNPKQPIVRLFQKFCPPFKVPRTQTGAKEHNMINDAASPNGTRAIDQKTIPMPSMKHTTPLEDLLRLMIDEEASDLHVSVGIVPVLRMQGSLVPLNLPALTSEDTEAFPASYEVVINRANVGYKGALSLLEKIYTTIVSASA